MGKISLYQSQQRLATESPNVTGVQKNPSVYGQAGRDLQVAGDAITQAHDTIQQAYDFQQVGEAKLKTLNGHNALLEKAQADGDNTGDFTQYDSEMAKIEQDALSGIANPQAKAKFKLDFDLSAAQTKAQISGVFRKNMVSKGLANLDELNINFINEYARTGDPELLNIKDYQIDTYTKQGFITAEQAQNLKVKTTRESQKQLFTTDKNNNPALAEQRLNSNFYNMTPDEIDSNRKELSLTFKSQVVDNRFNIISQIANNTFDYTKADDMVKYLSKTDIDLAEAIKKTASQGDYVPEDENNEAFATIIKDTFSAGSKDDISKILVQALHNKNNGEISRDRLNIIVNAALQRSKSLQIASGQTNGEVFDPKQIAIDAGVKAILSTKLNVATLPIAITDYFQSISNGVEAGKAYSNAVSKSLIKQNPDLVKFPNGRIGVDKSTGIKYKYFFDGRPREEIK